MRKTRPSAVWLALVLAVLTGCAASRGKFPAASTSQTELSRANFRVIEDNVMGRDTGFYLFGLVPIVSPSYGNAMQNLRARAPMAGRAAALANVTEDDSTIYLLLFSLPRITITADVIEFLPDEQAAKPAAAAPPPSLTVAPMVAEAAPPPPADAAPVTAEAPKAESDLREFCVEASPDLNFYGGEAHPLSLTLVQLSSVDAFMDADGKRLGSLEEVPGVVGVPVASTVYPGGVVTLQITANPEARFLGTVTHYKALKGNGRGYRSIADAGPGASCITLGRTGIEAP